jgi:2-dehydro-3-deoxy-D-arabinonate dehydratase
MRLFRTRRSPVVEHANRWFALSRQSWDDVVNRDDAHAFVSAAIASEAPLTSAPDPADLMAPIGSQEVWAAGVTYFRSRTARMEESKSAGGGDFYDRVYGADRPELFYKASPHRVRGPGEVVRIRRDARWNVPEPELTLAITSRGAIIGYTIGNDMSSRDIEGENPLYLPQAKVYDGSCGLGPAIYLTPEPLPPETEIRIAIRRDGAVAFEGSTTLSAMKRTPRELVDYLFRDNSFPSGCLLLTGTGVVPPDDFTLAVGDEVAISIDPIGTLVNTVAQGG